MKLSPCLKSVTNGTHGGLWSFTCDGSAAGIAKPVKAKVKAKGWEHTPTVPDASALIAECLKVPPLFTVPAQQLLDFVGDPCQFCGDARKTDCKPCDHCDGDGWNPCMCTKAGTEPARYGKAEALYDRRLVGIMLRSMPAPKDGAYVIGEGRNNNGKMMVIRSGASFAVVMEIRSGDKGPFPKLVPR